VSSKLRSPKILDHVRRRNIVLRASIKALKSALLLAPILGLLALLPSFSPDVWNPKSIAFTLAIILTPVGIVAAMLIVVIPIAFLALRFGWAELWVAHACGMLAGGVLASHVPMIAILGHLPPIFVGEIFGLIYWLAARRSDPTAFEQV
jgi:uncharacterized membrane protein